MDIWRSAKRADAGRHIVAQGATNDFSLLEHTFIGTRQTGKASRVNICIPIRCGGRGLGSRHLHTAAASTNRQMAFYEEGLHGGVVTTGYDVARHVDLLLGGVVPIVNLE